ALYRQHLFSYGERINPNHNSTDSNDCDQPSRSLQVEGSDNCKTIKEGNENKSDMVNDGSFSLYSVSCFQVSFCPGVPGVNLRYSFVQHGSAPYQCAGQ